jgi:hypothetical protein
MTTRGAYWTSIAVAAAVTAALVMAGCKGASVEAADPIHDGPQAPARDLWRERYDHATARCKELGAAGWWTTISADGSGLINCRMPLVRK